MSYNYNYIQFKINDIDQLYNLTTDLKCASDNYNKRYGIYFFAIIVDLEKVLAKLQTNSINVKICIIFSQEDDLTKSIFKSIATKFKGEIISEY